ncbi:hypothetical protein V866_006565 [Kwoniella sp. B9012]
MDHQVATRLSPFTVPVEVAKDLNALKNHVFVDQKPWEFDFPQLKRRAELIKDANVRGLKVWPGISNVTQQSKSYYIVCLDGLPNPKEAGQDVEKWTYITIQQYTELIETCEYQCLTLRKAGRPDPPQGFPMDPREFTEICNEDLLSYSIWQDTKSMLNGWALRREPETGLTKPSYSERYLAGVQEYNSTRYDEQRCHFRLLQAYKEEDQNRNARPASPEPTEISIPTYISQMSTDPNQYDPPPPLLQRHLPYRLAEIINFVLPLPPGPPSSVATSLRVGPAYATPAYDTYRHAISRWVQATKQARSNRNREESEEGEITEEDSDDDTETVRDFRGDSHSEDNAGSEELSIGTESYGYTPSIASSRTDAPSHLAYATDEEKSVFVSVSERAYVLMDREYQRRLEAGEVEEGEIPED